MIAYNWPIVTTYESILAMLVSSTDPKAVAIMGVAFGGISINLVFPFLL